LRVEPAKEIAIVMRANGGIFVHLVAITGASCVINGAFRLSTLQELASAA
jgi:hypothetical protein